MNENYLVTKSNTLINSNYDLSLEEQRIILTLASTVQIEDEDFKPYKFRIADFMNLLGVEDKSKYSVIPKVTKELMKKVFEIENGKKTIQLAWLSSAEYEKGSGYVELEFSPKLKPFMLGLKEFYTSYRLKNILELKGKYSIRMYEIIKSNEFKKAAEITVDELRRILKADKGSYLVYQNFKNRIIIQAQKELKEKTDVYFDFEEIKTGKKVTSLRFFINSNKKNLKISNEVCVTSLDEIEDVKRIIKNITGNFLNDKMASEIYAIAKKHSIDKDPLSLLQEICEYSLTQNIDYFFGWLKTMLLKYKRPGYKTKALRFNNFEARDIDYTKLEHKLLGWEE